MRQRELQIWALRYGVAIVAVGVAEVLTWLLWREGDPGLSPMFFAAVVVASLFGGLGPGLVATLVAGICSALFLYQERYRLDVASDDVLRVIVFLNVAVLISYLQASVRRSKEQLRQAKESAEAANVAKDRFLALVSHELRNPLSPVILAAAAMERDRSLPEPLREDLRMIRRNVELEVRLVDDLLDASRIAHGKLSLKLEAVDCLEPLQRAVDVCRPELTAKALELAMDSAAQRVVVRGDPTRLQQVFWNLLRNAIKFTPQGGRIAVSTSNVASALRVTISDNGVGIAAEALPRIFDAFEQGGDGVTRQYGGLGLGLAITKGLVEAQRGRITATSRGTGCGASFTVELPLIVKDETFEVAGAGGRARSAVGTGA